VLITDPRAAGIAFTTVDDTFSYIGIPFSALRPRPRARARHGRRIRQSPALPRINGSRTRLHSPPGLFGPIVLGPIADVTRNGDFSYAAGRHRRVGPRVPEALVRYPEQRLVDLRSLQVQLAWIASSSTAPGIPSAFGRLRAPRWTPYRPARWGMSPCSPQNEWTSCHRLDNSGYNPFERLYAGREIFFPEIGQNPRPALCRLRPVHLVATPLGRVRRWSPNRSTVTENERTRHMRVPRLDQGS
jgi:hypothetical protein